MYQPNAPMDPYAPPTSSEAPPSDPKRPKRPKKLIIAAIVVGVVYGLCARLVFGLEIFKGEVFQIMSIAFIFGVPTVLGFITVYIAPEDGKWWSPIVLPWLPSFAALAAALVLAWEGIICIFLWAPLFALLSSSGGLMGLLARRMIRGSAAVMFSVAILPFALAPAENAVYETPEVQKRLVHNSIDITASPETVWKHIERVPMIQPEEHSFALVHVIGFPKPEEAKLVGEGIGAVRHASFAGDVVFIETITEWDPPHGLAFTIDVDPDSIPPTSLDQHVTVGGEYFDVLTGRYRAEPLGGGVIRLHLESEHRVSTNFNGYAGWWTEFIMADTQQYILEILKKRCESEDATSAP